MRGRGSKFQLHRAKIHTPWVLRYVPALGLQGMSIKRKNHVFSLLFHHGHVVLSDQT